MAKVAETNARDFGFSVLVGAYAGTGLLFAVEIWGESVDPSELWAIPVGLFVFGAIAVPFVALGLAVFGLPVSFFLRHRAQDWWVGLFAVLWGALAGKLVFFAIDRMLFFGEYEFAKIGLVDMDILYSVPTALAWWLFCRRALAKP